MKKKSLIYGALAVLLVVAIGIGGTFAYLSYQTNAVDNPFMFVGTGKDKGIYAVITEPAWDGKTINPDYNGKTGTELLDPQNPSDAKLGVNMAKKVMPEMKIPKNPIITNKSKTTDALGENWKDTTMYVAMKITFLKGQDATGTPISVAEYNDNFKGAESIPYIGLGDYLAVDSAKDGKWIEDGNNTDVTKIFYWATKDTTNMANLKFSPLPQDVQTSPLFTSVDISKNLTGAIANTIYEWQGFNIKIEGAVCQADYITQVDAQAELYGLLTMP